MEAELGVLTAQARFTGEEVGEVWVTKGDHPQSFGSPGDGISMD